MRPDTLLLLLLTVSRWPVNGDWCIFNGSRLIEYYEQFTRVPLFDPYRARLKRIVVRYHSRSSVVRAFLFRLLQRQIINSFLPVQSAFRLTPPTLHEGLHFPNFMQVRAQVRSSIRLYTFRQRDKTARLLRTYWNLHDRRFAWDRGLRWIYLYVLCYSKNEN